MIGCRPGMAHLMFPPDCPPPSGLTWPLSASLVPPGQPHSHLLISHVSPGPMPCGTAIGRAAESELTFLRTRQESQLSPRARPEPGDWHRLNGLLIHQSVALSRRSRRDWYVRQDRPRMGDRRAPVMLCGANAPTRCPTNAG